MYDAVVIGVSAGGLKALKILLPQLPADFPLAVFIVQHQNIDADDFLARFLNEISSIDISQARCGESIVDNHVYLAPAGYHLLIEDDMTLSLSVDPPVNYAIPSIDVLFDTASEVYRGNRIGIVLTGANSDGSQGLKHIKENGGLALVEDPQTAEVDTMPKAAIAAGAVDKILPLGEIVEFLKGVVNE